MRNLKKFLALVLAMMMTLSLMVSVNAASDFTDVDTITDEFSEGVAVLEGLGVFEGYPDKTFKPKNSITRAEVATIVYRLATGDTEGDQAHLYADYQKFDDVKADHWAAGYINYCANAEWIAGYGNGKFGPNDNVTGYQAAAMILRAVGYGKNNEFTGPSWQVQVANFTRSLGLLENVNKTTYAATLNKAAPRELVAEILFQAGLIDTVNWTMLLGYQPTNNGSLSQINFDLKVGGWTEADEWGNPGYYWYKTTNTAANRVATIMAAPDMEFTDTKHECDIAHELDFEPDQYFNLYLNGKTAVTSNYRVVATDTTTKVGGQGRLTKVYDTLTHPYYDLLAVGEVYQWKSTVTMVDTFLAKVTGVSTAVLDAAGHVIVPARLTLTIYDNRNGKGANAGVTGQVVSKKSTDATNWDYSVGDMILMNAYTVRGTHTGNNTEKAAFETEQVTTGLTQGTNAWVLKVADSKVAKQTTVYWNQGKHNVDGTDTPDQIDLYLDVAGTATNSDFTWYFDQYNNIIGIGEATKSSYGVITSIYSSFNTADGATDGKAVAKAHVKYSDGSEGDITIDRFLVNNANPAGSTLTESSLTGELFPVYDYTNTGIMQGVANGIAPTNAAGCGNLMVSPVAAINEAAYTTGGGQYGIIKGNLYKFVASGDGKLTAIEVAGAGSSNGGVYVGHNDAEFATATNTSLSKSAGWMTAGSPAKVIRVNDSTQIMLKDGTAIKTYNGLSALPGNVTFVDTSKVDWVDMDNNGIAEVLYGVGSVTGSKTYGLFYYNGGASQWNNTDKQGTMTGWLNAEPKTLTFDNKAEFDAVLNSTTYAGHLFAVQLEGDTVTNLLGDNTMGSNHQQFVKTLTSTTIDDLDLNMSTSTTSLSYTSTSGEFEVGVTGGNGYTANTRAVHFDVGANATYAVNYNSANNTITITYTPTLTFILTGSSKVIGDDLSYLNTNKVSNITVVYENVTASGPFAVTEIYVDTVPDNTTSGGSVAATGVGSDVNQPVGTLANASDFMTVLRSNPNSGVWFWNDSAQAGPTSSKMANTLLYFPFRVNNGAGGESAALTIYDSNGNIVYTEGITTAATSYGMNWIVIEYVVGASNSSTGYWHTTQKGLSAGTYTYTIDVAGVRETSGSFTMV